MSQPSACALQRRADRRRRRPHVCARAQTRRQQVVIRRPAAPVKRQIFRHVRRPVIVAVVARRVNDPGWIASQSIFVVELLHRIPQISC